MYPNDTIKAISEFLFKETTISTCDLAIVFGNEYVDTMIHVKQLFDEGRIKQAILTGGSANNDREPEAIRFYRKGLELGIPPDKMVIESCATNTKENLEYSKRIIVTELGGFEKYLSIMFIAKAFVCRRIEMTARALNYPENSNYQYYPIVDHDGLNIGKHTWWYTQPAQDRVVSELQRIATYIQKGDLSIF